LSESANDFISEPHGEIKLDNAHRGELAELAFMREAASLGFAVAKPWGDSDRYDVIVRIGKIFSRAQVKSVWAKSPGRNHYRIHTTNRIKVPYTADEIDFLVGYIFPEDLWYIFPATVIHGLKSVCVSPGSRRSQNEQYRDAWKLMKPASAESGAALSLDPDASAEAESTLPLT
jgi:hypothetical protein